MKKRIISITLSVMLVLTTIMSATPAEKARADSEASLFSSKLDLTNKKVVEWEVKIPTKEEYMEYYNDLSESEKNEMNQRRRDALESYSDMLSNSLRSNKSLQSSRSSNMGYCALPGNFTIYQQCNEKWCGPAVLQSILTYINGTSLSQNQLAFWLGLSTTGNAFNAEMTLCLNWFQNIHNYYYYIPYGLDGMVSMIYYAIAYDQIPPSLLISTKGGKYWRYQCADGHYLVSHWISPSTERLGIADPFAGYAGIPQYYEERYDTVYNVIKEVLC